MIVLHTKVLNFYESNLFFLVILKSILCLKIHIHENN